MGKFSNSRERRVPYVSIAESASINRTLLGLNKCFYYCLQKTGLVLLNIVNI